MIAARAREREGISASAFSSRVKTPCGVYVLQLHLRGLICMYRHTPHNSALQGEWRALREKNKECVRSGL